MRHSKRKVILEESFKAAASESVSKGARPDFFRFDEVPRNFKGAILYNELKKSFTEYLKGN